MHSQEFSSFQELAKSRLEPGDVIVSAWSDIRCACLQKGNGMKKEKQNAEKQEALQRAIDTIKQKFSSPEEFRTTVTQTTFSSSMESDRQVLFHFARLWELEERHAETIKGRCDAVAAETYKVLVSYHGKHRQRPFTGEEWEREKQRKEQRKESRKREWETER